MSNIPAEWSHDEAWCSGCNCLHDLCECEPTLEDQLQASLTGGVVSRFDLPSESELNARHAELARLLREPPRRQGIPPKATAQKE